MELVRGRFRLRQSDQADGRTHLIRWFRDHAQPWLERRSGPWANRLGVDVEPVAVMDLKNRWGSCSPTGAVNFHWATNPAPTSVIDYVIVHELAHLREPHHTPEFWWMERAIPDYDERKRWLAANGAEYVRA